MVHNLSHQRLQLFGDRDHYNVIHSSYGAGWIYDRESDAAIAMLMNDQIAKQHRANRIVGIDLPVH